MCSNFVEDLSDKIIEKLNELEKYKYIASQVNYCFKCYDVIEGPLFFTCDRCNKIICDKKICCENWVIYLDRSDSYDKPLYYCSMNCFPDHFNKNDIYKL